MRSKIIKKAHKRDDFKLTSHNFLLCIRLEGELVLCQVLEQLKCPFFMLLSMQQPQQFHCLLLCYSLSSHSTLPRIHLATDIHNGNGFSPYCRSLLYS